MAWFCEALVLFTVASLAKGSLTKCYAKGGREAHAGATCFARSPMTIGDYVWIRMLTGRNCEPGGYALVQIGESEKSYMWKENLFEKDESHLAFPHWISHQKYHNKLQLRILEYEGIFSLRVVDYETERHAHYRKATKDWTDHTFEMGFQREYHDIKIFLRSHNSFEIWFNTKQVILEWKDDYKEYIPLNLVDFYRSYEGGPSNFGDGDIVSLEGVTYLQPVIASLGTGGFYEGGVVTIGTYKSHSMEVLFVTKESSPEKWKLVFSSDKIEFFKNGISMGSGKRNWDYGSKQSICDTIKIIRLHNQLLVYDSLPFDFKHDDLNTDFVKEHTNRFDVTWDGKIKKVIVRDGSNERNLRITHFHITNAHNPESLSFYRQLY